jgi:hypothetical protein
MTMVTFLRIVQLVLVLIALFNVMDVFAAKQVAFAQVCQVVTSVALLQLVAILQRSGHRLADSEKEEKAAKSAAGQ